MANTNLHAAKSAKNDEFYTQLSDIEKEVLKYQDQFRGKTVFLNCDDPEQSNFWLFFQQQFIPLGLKRLISTHFDSEKPTYKLEIVGDQNGDGIIDERDIIKIPLTENGDFRSKESIEILKEADIVCTNPPFSLFREYIAQLMEYEKKFLVIGDQNAVTYKEIFPYIKNNKIFWGRTHPKMYLTPETTITKNSQFVGTDGKIYQKFGNHCWFTNLETNRINEPLILVKDYDPKLYPKYDNYDAIEVNKVVDIPKNYDGVMGVPITFLDKYCPEQFEVLGIANSARWIGDFPCYTIINGEKIYNRILIRKK